MKEALILDNIDRGSTYSFLRASDFYITKKILKSSVNNWITILDLLSTDVEKKMIVVGKFTEPILNLFLDEEYEAVSIKLIKKLVGKRTKGY